jgi:hypothetical protein
MQKRGEMVGGLRIEGEQTPDQPVLCAAVDGVKIWAGFGLSSTPGRNTGLSLFAVLVIRVSAKFLIVSGLQ